jgi:serine protease Do
VMKMKQRFEISVIGIIVLIVLLLPTLSGCIDLTGNTPSSTTSTIATTSPVSAASTTTTPIDTTWAPPTASSNSDELPSIADAVALVKPAVVAINTEVVTQSIFGDFTQEGAGSGWVLDEAGIIVTNNHVVEGASTISVTLDDGRTFTVDPNSVHTDSLNDLAILSIDAGNLPALNIGDSSRLRVGDWVIAIGNALGLGIRATEGIISREGVQLPVDQDETLYDLLETTAVINPGNSGGPLVNLAGEVIGITSAKIAQTGIEGMGYAISINTAMPIIQQLVNQGHVTRPWLGVSIAPLSPSVLAAVAMDPELASVINVDKITADQGILLLEVVAGSPADNAGLKPGDVIISIAGEAVVNNQEFLRVLYQQEIGQPLEITYQRGDTESSTTAFPIKRTTSP